MAKHAKTNSGLSHEEIAKRAYAIYEKSGCQPGRDLENWLVAETELRASQKQNTSRRTRPNATAG